VIQWFPAGPALDGWPAGRVPRRVWRRINAEAAGFSDAPALQADGSVHRFQFTGLLIRVNFTLSL